CLVLLLGQDARRRVPLLAAASAALVGGYVLHYAILRFSLLDLLSRPITTGDVGSAYSLKLPWQLTNPFDVVQQFPFVLVATGGVAGALATGLLCWALLRNRSMFADTVVLTLLVGTAIWNLIAVETELQRHFSMIGAFLTLIVLAGVATPIERIRPWWLTATWGATAALGAAAALVLNAHLVESY